MSFGAEDRLHQWLRQELSSRGFDRIGDDGALLPRKGPWAVTQDHQIEGVHFLPGLAPETIARRLLAVNLSDLAAMGAQPAFAFLALSCPSDFATRRFFSSLLSDCDRYGVELAGGDLAKNEKVTASLTLLGTRQPGGSWLERCNGRPGDRLWIAGELGLSAIGRWLLDAGASANIRGARIPASLDLTTRETRLAKRAVRYHLLPTPQLQVGRWLAQNGGLAAIDISDGLALDLHRLCRASEVGARIELEALQRNQHFLSLCGKLKVSPKSTVLAGGEDYALLFAVSPQTTPPASLGCRLIGQLVADSELTLQSLGKTESLPAAGWDHFESTGRSS